MIRRIFTLIFLFIIFGTLTLFVVNGSFSRAIQAASRLSNPLELLIGEGGGSHIYFELPWKPDNLNNLGADISQYTGSGSGGDSSGGYAQQLSPDEIQERLDEYKQQMNDAKTFGEPSPYYGMVRIGGRASYARDDAQQEFVSIKASTGNTVPVTISGWSLQSVLNNIRIPLPNAASFLLSGAVNQVAPVQLSPGAIAFINSGVSPIGVSFRENICSGYLQQFQTFVPELDRTCPDPKDALPQTPENLSRYRAQCFSYIAQMPACHFPGHNLPNDVNQLCIGFLVSQYTYNGCVALYQTRVGFAKDSWRLFLNLNNSIWGASHDIIRLLDEHGRTVDVITY